MKTCHKIPHKTKLAAYVARKKINKAKIPAKMEIYFCNTCQAWHTGRVIDILEEKSDKILEQNLKIIKEIT